MYGKIERIVTIYFRCTRN